MVVGDKTQGIAIVKCGGTNDFIDEKQRKGDKIMKFVRVEYDNNRVAGAELTSHREVIEEYSSKGYKYLGFVPVKARPERQNACS